MVGKARLSLTSSINAHRVATCDMKLFNILRDDLFFFIIFVRLCYVKGVIFILNSNFTTLSFYESWFFNMVSDFRIFISHGTRGKKHENMRFMM